MPYIKQQRRSQKFDDQILEILDKVIENAPKDKEFDSGDLNYIISTIIWTLFEKNGVEYDKGNTLIGVLDCVQKEFYRRKMVKHEDNKMWENGDIDTNKFITRLNKR